MLSNNHQPLIYAHRGSSMYAPENTLAAFVLAKEQGADGIELDTKLSADGEVVVFHDRTVDRTTQGKGRVNQLTLAQLRQLDAGMWKGQSFKGEKIPTLAEVFEVVGGKMIINIELTNYFSMSDGLPEQVVKLVRKHKLEDSVMFSSFLSMNLAEVRKLCPEAPIGLLSVSGLPGIISRSWFTRRVSPEYCMPHHKAVTRELIEERKKAGRKCNVWTVNSPEVMRRMISFGVDGLITDDPLLGMKNRGEA